MRRVYLVAYDIADDKRLRRVFKKMSGFGEHLQFSVFQCELSDKERIEMIAALNPLINHTEDQILVFNLGPADGFKVEATLALGRPYVFIERHAIVV